jgi:predicted ATPase
MQIQIRNFGPIKEFDFELEKNLVAIFGKNNIGKSYATTIVYLILKNLLNQSKIELNSFAMDSTLVRFIEDLKRVFDEKGDIHKEMAKIFGYLLQKTLVENIQESFYATFEELDSIISQFSKKETRIVIGTDIGQLIIALKKGELVVKDFLLTTSNDQSGILNRLIKSLNQHSKTSEFDMIANVILSAIYNHFCLVNDKISVYYLPSSRSGLYKALSSFSQIFFELSKSRRFLTKKVEIPSLSEVVSDYLVGLSNTKMRKANINNAILSIVDDIQKDILKGDVIFDNDTQKIFYKPQQTDLVLDISLASSMVSELSPIVCYLKYLVAFAGEKSLIFIEEPEAHLHPETQILLMEIFAKLVNANVKIVMTSHSNYMFNKMNNLILDGKIEIASTQSIVLTETNEGSIAKSIDVDELGIDDENFIDATEELFNEKMALIDKLNEQMNHV